MSTYKKGIDVPLIFIECLQLLKKLIEEKLILQDPNNKDNILIYHQAGAGTPEGWYSEDIHSAAQELLHDIKGQRYLLNVLSEKGIDFEFTDVITPINNLLDIFSANNNA